MRFDAFRVRLHATLSWLPCQMSLNRVMKQASEKQFKCTVCDRLFTRIDHLKRHQLRHSGIRPYSCIFCSAAFARCDNLRDHYHDCPQRGDRLIPETSQRGRKRHACESCTSMKLRCDGACPCGACLKRNIPCTRQSSRPYDDSETRTDSTKSDDFDQTSERGSVKFLLNGGTDSFTEGFHLPSRHDRAQVLSWPEHNHNHVGNMSQAMSTREPVNLPDNAHTHHPVSGIESQPVDVAFYNDGFLQFFNGGYNTGPRFQPDETPTSFAHPPATPIQGLPLTSSAEPYFQPESPYSTNLIQSILSKSWVLGLDEISSMELAHELRFLLMTQRIQKFVALYFQSWHNNCPMIHQPSFNPETTAPTLLAAVVLMGATYSENASERLAAKKMSDVIEMFIFSTEVYSQEFEIAQSYKVAHDRVDIKTDWRSFENFQAGYLMFLIQYWGGSRAARNRVIEVRFGEVVRVARQMQLTKCRHGLEDQMSEYLWLQKECRIRTMILVSMIDSAMPFFQNYPSRLTNIEIQCDLPCHESQFAARHPFLEPDFRLSREMTVYQAFQNLFVENGPVRPLFVHCGTNKLHLGIMDMFLLIHQIYAHIHMIINLAMPQFGNRNINKTDCATVSGIKVALEHWRSLWISLRTELPSTEWERVGFFKGAYNYWLVAQLLISKNASVDILMRMEINCEDKLSQLKVLLPDDYD
ncbi:C2H2 finger domain-containing protein [Blastomyces dermatitidis ER-3]|uniref:C2H2 finger domain-containing protein n=4 Tax=Blastomyces TaxID=229219 RepID=A0A179UZ48_BLAGS|nr:C2H2 finger domain-containing protein [Blastomyces gilchristii SLH14081]XP_045281842.1 C2H2 finger domain-containing protein [Blastomyces dermatitidis ER-3]OAT02115.1 C2H2 finger domain-containing protein [Blastomyces dermatitidis ER-3]OAT13364.1 C2H2 finger domain-containing protein [Blastomyces gilchristii SLH14081]